MNKIILVLIAGLSAIPALAQSHVPTSLNLKGYRPIKLEQKDTFFKQLSENEWVRSRTMSTWKYSFDDHGQVPDRSFNLAQDFVLRFDGTNLVIDSSAASVSGNYSATFDLKAFGSVLTYSGEAERNGQSSVVFCADGQNGIFSDKNANKIKLVVLNEEFFSIPNTYKGSKKIREINEQYQVLKFDCIEYKSTQSDRAELEVIGYLQDSVVYKAKYRKR